APKKRPESSRPRPAVDRHFFPRNAVSLPAYFRRLRLFGRFGQLIKSIFAAISISFDLTLSLSWTPPTLLPCIPYSAVGIDRDARHNPSAAKSVGFCRGRHRSAVLRGQV